MKPVLILKELARPATDLTLLLAILAFALLSTLAGKAGLLGLWLAVLLLPALYRYLLLVLEACARGKAAPVAGIEVFNFAENFWSLAPLVIYAVAIWGAVLLGDVSAAGATLFALALLAVLPASLAVLAVTHSPFQSLNPAAWWRLVRACGADYLLLAVVVLLVSGLTAAVVATGVGTFVMFALVYYQLFLLSSFTGAVLHRNGVQFDLEIPDPVEPEADAVAEVRDRERTSVLNHAYGFVSRGNRAGGLAHIESAIRTEADRAVAYRWYFERMLEWESTDAALALAQAHLGWLLEEQRDVEALKLTTRCLLENAAFRPLPDDREALTEVAQRFRRDDLLRQLQGSGAAH